MSAPDKNNPYPLKGYNKLTFLKNIVKNHNIIVGDYTYYDDFENVENFEKNVRYHFDFVGDKLVIGKFCMIASDLGQRELLLHYHQILLMMLYALRS